MAKLGFRTFQDMIGKTDKLKFEPKSTSSKASLLNLDLILKNALDIRPGTKIQGGCMAQEFKLENRLVRHECESIIYFFQFRSIFHDTTLVQYLTISNTFSYFSTFTIISGLQDN